MLTLKISLEPILKKWESVIVNHNLDCIHPFIEINPCNLIEICKDLKNDRGCLFSILNSICGVDYLETDPKKVAKAGFEPHLEVVYHLTSFQYHFRLAIKIRLPRWRDNQTGNLPVLHSVTSIWPAANWHEREVYDLMGIRFEGHPDLARILLPDDWEGHPLRKDYEFPKEYHGIRAR